VGPALCKGCGALVWWAAARNGQLRCWRNRNGLRHDCEYEL
jgi:hypothetical protein